MCSITGLYAYDSVGARDAEIVVLMALATAHRGPDQKGRTSGMDYAFAHHRLAVIDPENGLQPMDYTYGEHTYTIVYNGELYNASELRGELMSLGHRFRTRCDTEVLAAACAQWNESCPEHLNGIFAYAAYDHTRRRLLCARDRLGVKPFFYMFNDGRFMFASEIKALLAHPDITAEIDEEGIWQLLFLSPTRVPGDGVFHGIRELLPGQSAVVAREGLRLLTYWRISALPHEETLEDTVTHTRCLILDAIERQMVSDVPVCSFLSGGLDSGFISAVAANCQSGIGDMLSTYSFEHTGNRTHFSASLFQPQSDEDMALHAAEALGTDHTALSLAPEEAARLLGDAMRMRDFPGMADVDASLLWYCRQVKRRHTVALSGECADEIFGGYPWFYRSEMQKDGFPWIHDMNIRGGLFEEDFAKVGRGLEYIGSVYRHFADLFPRLPGDDPAALAHRMICWLNLQFFMASLLERKDRMSMASGLEVRVPYADHRIMEYAYNVPWEYKYREGVEKWLLRQSARGILPDFILNRKKSPYPKTHDPRYESIVSEMLRERLRDTDSALRCLLRPRALEDLREREGIVWFGQLMGRPQLLAWLVQLDMWFSEYRVSIR